MDFVTSGSTNWLSQQSGLPVGGRGSANDQNVDDEMVKNSLKPDFNNNNNNCLFKVVRNSTKATRQKLSLVTDSAASVCSYDPQFTIDMLRVDY